MVLFLFLINYLITKISKGLLKICSSNSILNSPSPVTFDSKSNHCPLISTRDNIVVPTEISYKLASNKLPSLSSILDIEVLLLTFILHVFSLSCTFAVIVTFSPDLANLLITIVPSSFAYILLYIFFISTIFSLHIYYKSYFILS